MEKIRYTFNLSGYLLLYYLKCRFLKSILYTRGGIFKYKILKIIEQWIYLIRAEAGYGTIYNFILTDKADDDI